MTPIFTPLFIAPPAPNLSCGYKADYYADINYHGEWADIRGFSVDYYRQNFPEYATRKYRYREVLKLFSEPRKEYDITYGIGYEKAIYRGEGINAQYAVKVYYPGDLFNFDYYFITSSSDAYITVNYRVEYFGPGGPSYPYPVSCPPLDFFRLPDKPTIYLGTAAPPPPPPKNMDCCTCNDIATIIAENAIAEIKQHQATRDLVDRRTLEGLREINKMLQGMQINLDLQPVIDRLNQLEANLWNGLNGLGEG